MSVTPFRESRRSTRVPLKIAISVESGAARLKTEGETIVVNLHGALVSTAVALSIGMQVSIHVHVTDKTAKARIVYVNPENELHCCMELYKPKNVWGVPLPPSDWDEAVALER